MRCNYESSSSESTTLEQGQLPFVSVIMPIRNEATFIDRSLGAILAQDYPRNRMEVLIADGMSSDNTREVIDRLIAHQDIPVIILDNPGLIVSTGMNIAIRKARGDIIVRVDGHTIVESDYIHKCITLLERSGADNVGGPMRAIAEGYLANGIAMATSTPFGIGNSSFHYSDREQFVDTVYMGAFRKETLLRVGLFDEAFVRHQDYELNYRIRKNGGRIFLSPEIRSNYYVRDSLRKLCKQYFQYGYWKGKLLRRNIDSLKWRHAIPPLFVLLLLLGVMALPTVPQWRLLSWFVIAAYCAFITIAIFMATKDKHLKYALILPVIFPCLHLSWGLGTWFGVLSAKLPMVKNKDRS